MGAMSDLPPGSMPPPPPPPPASPPPSYNPPPMSYQPPPGPNMPQQQSPGYMPPPIAPSSGGGLNLGVQIAGAGWPIGIGAIGIVLPFVTAALFGSNVFYFRILPIFGIIYGVRAIMRGVVIRGANGIVLNQIAGLLSLTPMRGINHGRYAGPSSGPPPGSAGRRRSTPAPT